MRIPAAYRVYAHAHAPWPHAHPPGRSAKVPGVSTSQRYRLRTPSSGREVLLEAVPGEIYRDRESGEEMEIVGKLLPLAPDPRGCRGPLRICASAPGASSSPRRT